MTAPLYQIDDPAFSNLIVGSAALDQLYTGCRWAEGPVWFEDLQCLLFSDIPNQRILRWAADAAGGGAVSTFRQPSQFANGQTRDRQGRLVTCEHGLRRVIRTEVDGSITVLAATYQGKRLNSPNDVVVQSDGSIWFTDPTYGILSDYEGYQSAPEQPVRGVYRVDGRTGEITCVVDDFSQPNGLAFSPDEGTLYIADSGASHDHRKPRHIRAFDVADGKLSKDREFAVIDAGIPDGIRTDTAGNLWSSAADGVHCFAPDGHRLGKILVAEEVANLTFGGPRRNRLFITATSSLYAVYLTATGAQRP
ncbi:MAG: SMP-30/gluconolactonase/LRE family protein [Tabrizicola sp.]|uniref:SMP-30/gluconolactonase/LRE family protein n=1 Tax=Tabrizicola sp. TaxID=2005166 RepID=UPI00273481D0|nr:SMP-30/gluconolactonase/LRE family protein [Tabrizicola sp.]MDP3264939.1 SMP-30/gluconolactonase/LRE family protein [Tabrizicola sp.]MDZ4068456.1 SMP-30/gluconolactonase/LRE family protein [Tabrizicola sp.]